MTASARSRSTSALALAAVLLAGCATDRALVPTGSALEPLVDLPGRAPDAADDATRAVAVAVLLGDAGGAAAGAARIEADDARRRSEDAPPSGLAPYAADARNALLPSELDFRAGQRELLRRDDLPPELERRVRSEVEDDPLALAQERLWEARGNTATRVVNSLVQAIGTSFANPILLVYRVTASALGLGIAEHQEDPLTTPERQALGHWKAFVEQHPDSPEAQALLDEIDETQRLWLETQRRRNVRRADRALENDSPALARALAQRALRYAPEDRDATRIRNEAEAELAQIWANRLRSVQATPPRWPPARERELAVALLARGGAVSAAAHRLAAREEEISGALADEAELAKALALFDARRERDAWRVTERVADEDLRRSNMARHAITWRGDPDENPSGAFRRANRQITWQAWRTLAFGALAEGPPERDLPFGLDWGAALLDLPGVVLGLPARIIAFPFERADRRVPAVLARRYLERFPVGAEAPDLREWLVDYEQGRSNHVGALRVAESAPDPDVNRILELREEAAAQALETTQQERRLEVRLPLLLEIASRFPGTEDADEAGRLVREEMDRLSEQQIRVSKGFLRENPRVASRSGLGLRPDLLDGEIANGELHPDGITLIGSGMIEVAYVAASGRTSDPPERRRERVSDERLARLVAQLDEASEEIARTDRDARFEPDARRDFYFERARLGADAVDVRPEARSSYEYTGLRERYGVVRGRESILPAEIVLQGSFTDFSLGAFPHFRPPRSTPNRVLYE